MSVTRSTTDCDTVGDLLDVLADTPRHYLIKNEMEAEDGCSITVDRDNRKVLIW